VKRLVVLALVVMMESAVVAAALSPAAGAPGAPAGGLPPEGVAADSAGSPVDLVPERPEVPEATTGDAVGMPYALPADDTYLGPFNAPEPFVPRRTGFVGGSTPEELAPPDPAPEAWWFARAPTPQSVQVTSNSSVILFVRQVSPAVATQIPTVAEVAAGARPIAFHNASLTGFNFTGKLFETTVGNQSLNQTDKDLGIPNQTLDIFFDGSPLATVPSPVVTGNATAAIPQPFVYPNGSFEFYVPQFAVSQCGAHTLRILYDNLSYGNNASYFSRVEVSFSVHVTCPTTLTLGVNINPATVGDEVIFSGDLRTQDVPPGPVPGREIKIYMENQLLGDAGPGVCLDEVSVNGTLFDESFEQDTGSGTGWNSTGLGAGTWAIGQPTNKPYGPPNLFGTQMACTALDAHHGRGVDTFLTTPRIDLTAAGPSPFLAFFYWYNISYDDYFEVLISVDGGLTFTAYQETISATGLTSGRDKSGTGEIPPWTARQISLAPFAGSPQLVVAFHFRSAPYTTFTGASGAYLYRFTVPLETLAQTHNIYSAFERGMPRDPIDDVTVTPSLDPETSTDLVFEASRSLSTIRFEVKRIAHFEFPAPVEDKVGYRGKALGITGCLVDNMGEPLLEELFLGRYVVRLGWDRDYNDPTDTPLPLGQTEVNYDAGGCFGRNYVVDVHQALGLHNVSLTFEGSTYYTPATGLDAYRLMAHVTVEWPPDADRYTFRFQNATVNGSLRILKNESRFDLVRGDPVPNELLHVTWEGGEIPEGQVGVLSNSTGGFSAIKRIQDEPLGRKQVVLRYDGSDVYVAVTSATNWSVVSRTTIQLEETSVYKGSFLWFNGSLLDDRGGGIAGQTLQLFFDQELVQPVSTGSDGSYSYRHFVDKEFTVGLKEARVRFFGNPIYLANETILNVSVKAHTQLERTDHTLLVERGQRLNVSGRLFEVYEGGALGDTAPVALEPVAIRIEDRRLTLETTNTEGEFVFRSAVPGDLDVGEARLVFEFNGSDFYDAAENETLVVIQGRSVVNFDQSSIEVNGAPFDVRNGTLHQQETMTGIIRVTDELGNPVASGDLRFFFSYQTGDQAEPIFISAGPVDELGRFSFNVTFPESDFVRGNRTLLATYNGSFCPTSISARTLCLKPATGNMSFRYEVDIDEKGDEPPTLLYIVVGAVATILGGVVYFFWYAAKRRQLQRMQRIIRRAADRLVSGNPYAQVIFDAYRSLARYLQANGYLRADSETFREFENALRQALPIDAKSMDEFLSILEEARYSDHEIGEAQKDRAVASLTAVTNSIDQILSAGGAAAAGAVPAPMAAPAAPPVMAEAQAPSAEAGEATGADEGGAAPEEGPKEP